MSNVIAKESFKASILTYIGAVVGFLTTLYVMPKYLLPEEIGLIRLLQDLAAILSNVAMLGLTSSISRFFPYFKSKDNKDLVHNGFTYYVFKIASIGTLLTLLIALPTFFCFKEEILNLAQGKSSLFADYYYLVIPLMILVVFWSISEIYSLQFYKLSIPKGIRELLLRVLALIAYLIYAYTSLSFGGFLALFIGNFAICTLASILYLSNIIPLNLNHNPKFISPSLRKDFNQYTLLTVLSNVTGVLALRMDVILLSFIPKDGLAITGVYSIAFFLCAAVEIPTRSIISIATPRIAEAMKEEDYEGTQAVYQKVAFYQFLSGLILVLLIWLNFDNILSIIPNGQTTFQSIKQIFLFLAIGKLVELILTPCHPIIQCSKYYRSSLYYSLLYCLIAALANIYLIPLMGGIGAALSMMLSSIICYGFLQIMLYSKLRIQGFSWQLLALLPLALMLIGVNEVIPYFINPFIDLILRSALLGGLATGYLYFTGISTELFDFLLAKIKK